MWHYAKEVRVMRELNEKDKTTLDEHASIYAKRDDRSAIEQYRSLKGEEKQQYFKDYFLPRIIGIAIGIACLVFFLVSIFKPKDEIVYHVAVLDSPFSTETVDTITEALTEKLTEEGTRQLVSFDTAYFVSSDGYNARTRLMTYIAAGEIDCMILPSYELNNYVESGVYEDLYIALPKDILAKISDDLIYMPTASGDSETVADPSSETCYAVKITDNINRLNGFEINEDYYLVCVVNTKHPEGFEVLTDILYELNK